MAAVLGAPCPGPMDGHIHSSELSEGRGPCRASPVTDSTRRLGGTCPRSHEEQVLEVQSDLNHWDVGSSKPLENPEEPRTAGLSVSRLEPRGRWVLRAWPGLLPPATPEPEVGR